MFVLPPNIKPLAFRRVVGLHQSFLDERADSECRLAHDVEKIVSRPGFVENAGEERIDRRADNFHLDEGIFSFKILSELL